MKTLRNGLGENSEHEHTLDELLRGLSEEQSLVPGDIRPLSPVSVTSSAECPPSTSHSFAFPGVIQQGDTPVSSPNPSDVGEERAGDIPTTGPVSSEREAVGPVKEKVDRKTHKRENRISSNEEDIPDGVRLPQRKGGMHLWQFLYAMLRDTENRYANLIEWTRNEKDLEFRLLEPEAIAVWWGHHKNKSNMSYDKLSRSLRYYYDKGIIRKINGERYVYRFCIDPELMYKHIGNSENRPQLKPMPEAAKRAMSQFQPNGGDYCNHTGNISSPKVPLVAQDPDLLHGRCQRKRSSSDQQVSYQATSYPSYYQDYRTVYDPTSSYLPANSYPPEAKRSNSVELYTHSDPFAPYAGSTIYYQRECISLPSSYNFATQVDHSQSSSYLHYPPISNSPDFIAMSSVSTMPESTTSPHVATGTSVPPPPPLTSTSSDDSVMSTYSPNGTSLSPSVNEVFPMFSSSASGTSTWHENRDTREAGQMDGTCISSPSLVEDNYLFSFIPAGTGFTGGNYQWATSELSAGADFDLMLSNN